MERNTSINIPKIGHIIGNDFMIWARMSDEERATETLQDKKALWLAIVELVPDEKLSEKDKTFKKKYQTEGVKLSKFYKYKKSILQFIEEQKVRYDIKNL